MKHFTPIILVFSLVVFTGCGSQRRNLDATADISPSVQNEQLGVLPGETLSLGWSGNTSNEVAEAPAMRGTVAGGTTTESGATEDVPGFNLYGRTIDNEIFDWASLRGKYVLVKFTATWCPPCERAIPGMLELYRQYHNQGLEIVSVYIFQQEADPVATVRNYVGEKGLPWIILSEELSTRAGQPPQGIAFEISGVPTFFLLDTEGEIVVNGTHSVRDIPPALARLFGE